MATLSLTCSLPLQPPSSSSSQSQSRKLIDSIVSTPFQYSSSSTTSSNGSLKPIVVDGDPPTFVSAPGRRIVAGSFHFCFLGFQEYYLGRMHVLIFRNSSNWELWVVAKIEPHELPN